MKKHINDDCIIPSISGRLGNNMFMIAHAYARGLEQNRQMVALRGQVIHAGVDYSTNMFRKIDFVDDFPQGEKVTVYGGYFQSEKYFEQYTENIKSLYSAPNEFVERMEGHLPFLFTDIPVTAIHIRRGDYLHYPSYHPSVSPSYIHEAIKQIPDAGRCLIFSDDVNWCQQNLQIDGTYITSEYLPHEQIWLMSLCDNFVISNSSFSWWGAYLSRQPNKIVVAPETWYGPDGPSDWEEIYCKDWMKMPTYYNNGQIHPKL
jgi:hypothetical protein